MRDLSSEEQTLVERARQAARSAYCPYSRFPVGAVVESEELGLTIGINIENASYGLAVCAERVALFSAIAQGAKHFRRLAVSCLDAKSDDPPGSRMPCGACRQVMAEFLDADGLVLVDGVGAVSVAELLPNAFQLSTRPFLEATEQDPNKTTGASENDSAARTTAESHHRRPVSGS